MSVKYMASAESHVVNPEGVEYANIEDVPTATPLRNRDPESIKSVYSKQTCGVNQYIIFAGLTVRFIEVQKSQLCLITFKVFRLLIVKC